MLSVSVTILLSAAAVLTIPADLPGTPHDGAQMIVGLQGMVFCGAAIIRGAWFLAWNWSTLREAVRDLSSTPH
jgi:hypothetical protein